MTEKSPPVRINASEFYAWYTCERQWGYQVLRTKKKRDGKQPEAVENEPPTRAGANLYKYK